MARIAIVTGAAQGIGQAYADALVADGFHVAYVDLKADLAQANAKQASDTGGTAIGVGCDVSSQEDVLRMVGEVVETLGGVDVLVNNAALYEGYSRYTFMEIPVDYWNRFVAVNVTSALICAQAVVPHFIARGGGKIVNQSSGAAVSAFNHYGLTKLAVQGLTVGLARELGPKNINVNAIAPGVIVTPATQGHFDEDELERRRVQGTALQRLGKPSDLVPMLRYLCSPDSDFVTGQIFHINGGGVMIPL